MQTAEFNHQDFEQSQQSQLDEQLLVKFFLKARPDKAATEKEGRPMFKEVEYIDIKVAGNSTAGACRPARQGDIDRFPRHYQAFKNRVAPPESGTPLAQWGLLSTDLVAQFSFMNIKTVEQLANLSDTYASQIMGGGNFKRKAADFLVYTKDQKQLADKFELTRENKELKETVQTLTERLDKLESDQKAQAESVKAAPVPVAKKKAPARKRKAPAKKRKTAKKKV